MTCAGPTLVMCSRCLNLIPARTRCERCAHLHVLLRMQSGKTADGRPMWSSEVWNSKDGYPDGWRLVAAFRNYAEPEAAKDVAYDLVRKLLLHPANDPLNANKDEADR
jgi:hypothetical protein